MSVQHPEPGAVVDALERIYARPEFAERNPSGFLQLLSDLRAAMRHWMGSTFGRLLPESVHPAFLWIVFGVLCALAAWALFALFASLRKAPRAEAEARGGRVVVREGRNAAAWEAAARAAAAAGRFREAALALYQAVVLRLEERGAVRYHAGKTPGDYGREVRGEPGLRSPYDRFVRQLLPVAYGARTPEAASFERLRSAASELGVNA